MKREASKKTCFPFIFLTRQIQQYLLLRISPTDYQLCPICKSTTATAFAVA